MAMNSLSMGGLRLFGRALLAFATGAVCAGAWLGFALPGPTPAATMLATLTIMVTYSGWVSLLAYNQALRLAKSKTMLREASISDALTGLRNRRYFHQVVDQDIARALRGYQPYVDDPSQTPPHNADLVFLMVDIDHFKALNDSHGHEAGDQVLVQLAERLKSRLRDSDSVIRWGGEEFLVVARSVNRPQIRVIAEKIRKTIEQRPFELGDGTQLFKTCSIGFAPFPFFPCQPSRFGWSEVVALADEALYIAKNSKRNAWVGLVPDLSASLDDQCEANPTQLLQHPLLRVETSLSPETPLIFPGPGPGQTTPLRA
jgi:diguanylate cyclase (GGDEF)-like protein